MIHNGKLGLKVLTGAGVAGVLVIGLGLGAFMTSDGAVLRKVKVAFPGTEITSVDCGAEGPLCEVVAGKSVFYTTRDARYIVVGSVLDVKEKKDLTDLRLRELAAVNAFNDKIGGTGVGASEGAAARQAAAPSQDKTAPTTKLAVDLPKGNAVIHNPGAPIKLTIFTDLNCSFCNRLHADLKGVTDIEVTEYLVAFLGPDSRQKAKLALCSADRSAAVDAIYQGGEVRVGSDCAAAEAAVDQNTQFAQRNGIEGTPMIIRADGSTRSGWMPLADLRAFLGARS